jgi:hypothetical protein
MMTLLFQNVLVSPTATPVQVVPTKHEVSMELEFALPTNKENANERPTMMKMADCKSKLLHVTSPKNATYCRGCTALKGTCECLYPEIQMGIKEETPKNIVPHGNDDETGENIEYGGFSIPLSWFYWRHPGFKDTIRELKAIIKKHASDNCGKQDGGSTQQYQREKQ